MRIITWNINSVRLRLPLVLRMLEEQQPDVLCLQETKTIDLTFPAAALAKAGYEYQHAHGMKGYNGVAIISRLPLTEPTEHHWCGREDRRHIAAVLPGGIALHNYYVPAGGDIPDRSVNEKFGHKLDFVAAQTEYWAGQDPQRPAILVGDLNIAPLEHDVWSHKALLDVVSHTPIEVERLKAWQQAGKFYDAIRHFVPEDQKLYSWWSYRSADWKANDRGRRLDHIWVTPPLIDRLKSHAICRDYRDAEKPSDHVPVVLDLQ